MNLPKIKNNIKPPKNGMQGDVRMFLDNDIQSRWNPEIRAAASDDAAVINILDVVGEDYWTGDGMTAKVVSSVLRKNKGQPITVNINSPGGDFFEGVAIYNLLKEHDGEIHVRIIGMAASAASVIAMAGTTIKIAESGFLMIHNSWHICIGNKHDMHERGDVLAQFDESMQGVYAKKTGMSIAKVTEMMDAESWIGGADAVDQGFATSLLDSDEIEDDGDDETNAYSASLKVVDVALAKSGKTRSERRAIIKDLSGTPCATDKDPDQSPCADQNVLDAMASLSKTITTKRK